MGGGRHRGVHMTVLIIEAGCYTVKPEPRTTTYSTHTTAEDPDQTAGAAIWLLLPILHLQPPLAQRPLGVSLNANSSTEVRASWPSPAHFESLLRAFL